MSKEDWFKTGLEILGDIGRSGLTIERMADEVGLTKGSFYHHFKNMRNFEEGLVDYWADQYLSTNNQIPDTRKQTLNLLDEIMENAFTSITKPEIAIRAWAQQDEFVRKRVEEIDRSRHDFVHNVFLKITGDENRAGIMADMLFTILIGSITAVPRFESGRVLALYQEFKLVYGLNIS